MQRLYWAFVLTHVSETLSGKSEPDSSFLYMQAYKSLRQSMSPYLSYGCYWQRYLSTAGLQHRLQKLCLEPLGPWYSLLLWLIWCWYLVGQGESCNRFFWLLWPSPVSPPQSWSLLRKPARSSCWPQEEFRNRVQAVRTTLGGAGPSSA